MSGIASSRKYTQRWEQVGANPLFRSDLDHGSNYPGGTGFPYSVNFASISGIKYHRAASGAYTRTNFIIDHVEWCSQHCLGEFYRMRDPEQTAKEVEKEDFDPEKFYNHFWDVSINIMTFQRSTDAIRFKLAGSRICLS